MVPLGAQPLNDMRMDGQVPENPIWVLFGDFREPDYWKHACTADMVEVLIRPTDPLCRLDFRFAHGLTVFLLLQRYDDAGAQLYARLKDYAAEIQVASPDFGDDCGWFWLRRYGEVRFEDRPIVTAFEAAKLRRSICADRRDQAGYDRATAIEVQLLETYPWLRA